MGGTRPAQDQRDPVPPGSGIAQSFLALIPGAGDHVCRQASRLCGMRPLAQRGAAHARLKNATTLQRPWGAAWGSRTA
jgi:hypothetical protein